MLTQRTTGRGEGCRLFPNSQEAKRPLLSPQCVQMLGVWETALNRDAKGTLQLPISWEILREGKRAATAPGPLLQGSRQGVHAPLQEHIQWDAPAGSPGAPLASHTQGLLVSCASPYQQADPLQMASGTTQERSGRVSSPIHGVLPRAKSRVFSSAGASGQRSPTQAGSSAC